MKIYLLSYAGGSSISYMSWRSYFKNHTLELLDYKGHGLREKETADSRLEDIAADIAEQIASTFNNEEFVVFGHSMGGMIAWLTTKVLTARYKIQPETLVVSACPAPVDFSIILPIQESEILEILRNYNHVSLQTLQSNYFRERVFPVIKHDFALVSQYRFDGNYECLSLPAYVCYGMQDELAPIETMRRWEEFTTKECQFLAFEGKHFYFNEPENRKKLCQLLDNL